MYPISLYNSNNSFGSYYFSLHRLLAKHKSLLNGIFLWLTKARSLSFHNRCWLSQTCCGSANLFQTLRCTGSSTEKNSCYCWNAMNRNLPFTANIQDNSVWEIKDNPKGFKGQGLLVSNQQITLFTNKLTQNRLHHVFAHGGMSVMMTYKDAVSMQ